MKKHIDRFVWFLPVLVILGLVFIRIQYRNNLNIWVMYYRVTIVVSICCFIILSIVAFLKLKKAIREKDEIGYQIFSIVAKTFLVWLSFLTITTGFNNIPPVSIDKIKIVYDVHSGKEVDGLVWSIGEKGREDVAIWWKSARYSMDFIDTMIIIYSEDNIFTMNGETIEFKGYDTRGQIMVGNEPRYYGGRIVKVYRTGPYWYVVKVRS